MAKQTTREYLHELEHFKYSVTDANNCNAANGTFTVVEPEAIIATAITVITRCTVCSMFNKFNGGSFYHTLSNGAATEDIKLNKRITVEITDKKTVKIKLYIYNIE
jgi:hypothetical protein